MNKEYDVALSYAGEDRDYVEQVANALIRANYRVFFDVFEEADLIGRNLIDHLSEIYSKKAKFCVVFISSAYAKKPFPRLERQAAQSRALKSDEPYIIPVRLDDTEIPGLLSTVAFVKGKTANALAQLVISKLCLTEPKGFTSAHDANAKHTVLIRFNELFEPDIDMFKRTLNYFSHWPEAKQGSMPIEIRLPHHIIKIIDEAADFRVSKQWRSPNISEEARKHFENLYDEELPEYLSKTIKGIQHLLLRYYKSQERLFSVMRLFLSARIIALSRRLLDYRLIGMPSNEFEYVFACFERTYSDWIMYGLSYVCYLDGSERFLWIDTDGFGDDVYRGPYRLYAPIEYLLRNEGDLLNSEDFDRYFAVQLLMEEIEKPPGCPLYYFSNYPERLKLYTRGEWAIDCDHFGQHSTFNFGGEPLYESVASIRKFILDETIRLGLPEWNNDIKLHRLRSLLRDGEFYDRIIFPSA